MFIEMLNTPNTANIVNKMVNSDYLFTIFAQKCEWQCNDLPPLCVYIS